MTYIALHFINSFVFSLTSKCHVSIKPILYNVSRVDTTSSTPCLSVSIQMFIIILSHFLYPCTVTSGACFMWETITSNWVIVTHCSTVFYWYSSFSPAYWACYFNHFYITASNALLNILKQILYTSASFLKRFSCSNKA